MATAVAVAIRYPERNRAIEGDMPLEDFVTVPELARILTVAKTTVTRAIEKGEIKGAWHPPIGRIEWRIPLTEAKRLVEAAGNPPYMVAAFQEVVAEKEKALRKPRKRAESEDEDPDDAGGTLAITDNVE